MSDPSADRSFLARFKERKLVQWAVAYLAGGWLVLQVLDVAADPWGLTSAVVRAIQALIFVGFFVTLVLAWYHGEQGRQRVSGAELLIIAGLLGLFGIGFQILSTDGPPGVSAEGDVGSAPVPAVSGEQSVAVLPFVNMSGDPENEYFSDGITEELLNALAQIPGLRVPARTSSFAFKGQNLPVRMIADTLRVAHVLEGSVRRDADRVLITAQLIDARADTHLWSESYERRLENVFAIQREIAAAIAGQLRLSLSGDAATGLDVSETANIEAHDHYLRGKQLVYQRTRQGMLSSIESFRTSLELEPEYAPAHVGLATAYALAVDFAMAPPDSSYRWAGLALAHADRAIELDPRNGEAYAVRGFATFLGPGQPPEIAEADFVRSLSLLSNSADALGWYGQLLAMQGRSEEAREAQERSLLLDPVAPGRRIGYTAGALWDRDHELALEQIQRARAIQPELGALASMMEGYALALLGRSRECLDRRLGLAAIEALCLHEEGRVAEAAARVDSIAATWESTEWLEADNLAAYHAWIGEVEEALLWVARGLRESPYMPGTWLWPASIWDRALAVDEARVRSEINRLSEEAWRRIEAERRLD